MRKIQSSRRFMHTFTINLDNIVNGYNIEEYYL